MDFPFEPRRIAGEREKRFSYEKLNTSLVAFQRHFKRFDKPALFAIIFDFKTFESRKSTNESAILPRVYISFYLLGNIPKIKIFKKNIRPFTDYIRHVLCAKHFDRFSAERLKFDILDENVRVKRRIEEKIRKTDNLCT